MKAQIIAMTAVLAATATSLGATITFSPLTLVWGVPGGPAAKWDVYVTASTPFNGIDITFGSDATNVASKMTWTWNPNVYTDEYGKSWPWDIKVAKTDLKRSDMPKEIYVSAAIVCCDSNDNEYYAGPSLMLGTLTFPIPSLPDGSYRVMVSGTVLGDGIGRDGVIEPLNYAYTTFALVPEPATLSLLVLGTLLVGRRCVRLEIEPI